ncbi:PAS domain-containing protein [Hydrogenimonas sp.]
MAHVINRITQERIPRPTPLPLEEPFHRGTMVSETDLEGVITYANRRFCEMSGYSRRELVGAPHNLVRHPDMPKEVFREMWRTIEEGRLWRGYLKNLRKDGKFYWVLAYIQPKFDINGEKVGYVAVRKLASRDRIERVEVLYEKLKQGEGGDVLDLLLHDDTLFMERLRPVAAVR